jgi:hypothetical protein
MCCRISIKEKSEAAEVPTLDNTYGIDIVIQLVASATREPHRPAANIGRSHMVRQSTRCDVAFEVCREAGDVYKIFYTATGYNGVNVSMESYTEAWDHSYILDSALNS